MVHGFVKQAGGHVTIESALGEGTRIRLYLPRTDAERGAEQEDSADAVAETPARPHTVLVVEDNAIVRSVAVARFEELGHSVLEAESAAEAIEHLSGTEPIDLLFTDVVMAGGMTGIDLAREANRRRPGLKTLFTSGYAEPSVIERGLPTADSAWLGKPHGVAELQVKLRQLLDG
jgi:CheY-like chemotaxis protein